MMISGAQVQVIGIAYCVYNIDSRVHCTLRYQAWDAEAATVVTKLWPHWAWGLIAVLVLVSALWLPGVAIAR